MSERTSGSYAFWKAPNSPSKVIYSLPLFYDIDAEVSDAFRRIPRGGIEDAGLLFGRIEADATYIEAFRSIHSQHASGPSFVLSEQDLAALEEQLKTLVHDAGLTGLRPIGWFVGHTRSPLSMGVQERQLFDRFFPEPGCVAVLVKPETFQATQFDFLMRSGGGQMPGLASGFPVIMPLPGRGESAERLRESIPAPAKTQRRSSAQEAPAKPSVSTPPKAAPRERIARRERELPPFPGEDIHLSNDSGPQQPAVPDTVTPPLPGRTLEGPVTLSRTQAPPASIPPASLVEPPQPPPQAPLPEAKSVGFVKSVAVLALAAILGCLAGYWAYLQLPSPIIPLRIHEEQNLLIVEWPPAQTQAVDYAALQMNDGRWLALSDIQRNMGRAVIPDPPGDVQIKLIAKHWLRDSRGHARYIRP